ncbi:D-ribose pyranase [Paenibacillus sacheonensis]|uniref:D-ribose pyranase n=1 Tax=Paenibacillus sacheonensis TaxID=742054 RepID=A0A7X4YLZ3_9BACL|nr:D-ribose pyranase [Paenibacillus sacheonensis]MBM7565856.1 D-ribose pyranase [Paenibacillus sacheonensis]NBC68825.1 D-ribose pyranase [Paenibacillus sacheonensis]
MKKTALLHPELSQLIASLGHTDKIVIADCGLPIPRHVRRIDLALVQGIPSFVDTLQAVLSELVVEAAVIAEEWLSKSDGVQERAFAMLDGLPITKLPHEEFKRFISEEAAAVIRTGENTPYANMILQAGVAFEI